MCFIKIELWHTHLVRCFIEQAMAYSPGHVIHREGNGILNWSCALQREVWHTHLIICFIERPMAYSPGHVLCREAYGVLTWSCASWRGQWHTQLPQFFQLRCGLQQTHSRGFPGEGWLASGTRPTQTPTTNGNIN